MNTSAVATSSSRAQSWAAQRYGIFVSTGILLIAYAALDVSWRETLKAGLVFALGSYPLCRLLQGRSQRIAYFAWITLFAVHTGVKAFLSNFYGTDPDTLIVVDAISNTNSEETVEFMQQYGSMMLGHLLATILLLGLLVWLRPNTEVLQRHKAGWAIGLLVIFVGLHANPTFRGANPIFFWPTQAVSYQRFHNQLGQLHIKRRLAEQKLPMWAPVYDGPKQHTIAVVIGESTNRWNWQLYGYPRATTPELMHETQDALVFRDVISGAAGTVGSFRLMLTPAVIGSKLDDEAEPSVVMLAKAAGYKTFWISNQHDRFINSRYAEEADSVTITNTGGGRSDRKLDEDVLPYWDAALKDPAPRKMIFVHLLGAHAHYDLRSPPSFHRFSNVDDATMETMRRDGRSLWVRMMRNSYDNAILYQDTVIARLLDSFKADVGTASGAFLYTPDHAEEVGHTRDFAGHSLSEAGVTVPLIVWKSQAIDPATKRQLEQRPFQTDVLDWTLLDLAHIETSKDQPQLDLLGPDFVAQTRYIGHKPYEPSAFARDLALSGNIQDPGQSKSANHHEGQHELGNSAQ